MLVAPLSTSLLYLGTHSTLDCAVQDLLVPEEEIFPTVVLLNLKLKRLSIWGTSVSLKKYREGSFFAG